MHTRYFQVGGVIEDIPPGFERKLREFLKVMPERADEYGAILNANEIVLAAPARHVPARRRDAARRSA